MRSKEHEIFERMLFIEQTKLRQLEIQNHIIDNTDSKQSKLGQQFTEDSNFIVEIVLALHLYPNYMFPELHQSRP